jgi:hypothetical protein
MSGLVKDLRNIMYSSAVPKMETSASTLRTLYASQARGVDLPFTTGASAIQGKSQSSPVQDSKNFHLADTSDVAWDTLHAFFK